MAKRVYGNLICQNGVHEVLRCIESVYSLVDKYFVMDGGSTDGTWELLNKYKDVYKLTLFQHPYTDQGDQRNRLLTKFERDCWVINIDQDEQLSQGVIKELRDFINQITPSLYTDKKRELPLSLRVGCINLVKDTLHYDNNKIMSFGTKIFYKDRNIHFSPGYHMSVNYFDGEQNHNMIPVPDSWKVKHYAYLNPDRLLFDSKRHYTQDERDSSKWNVRNLPQEWI